MRYVYFHGFASSPLSRKAQAFRVAFADRGVTLSIPQLDGGDFEHLTISGQLKLAEDLIQGETVSLIGSSMGGYLAALYASRHPEMAKLVLLAPAFGFSSRWTALTGPEKLASWKDTNALEVYHYGEQRTRNLSYSLFEDALNYAAFPDVSQPTLIFHGMHDDVVPIELSREFAANRPKVTLLELDSDHELLSCLDEIVSESVPFLCSGAIPERV